MVREMKNLLHNNPHYFIHLPGFTHGRIHVGKNDQNESTNPRSRPGRAFKTAYLNTTKADGICSGKTDHRPYPG